jgi:hypothetical protein
VRKPLLIVFVKAPRLGAVKSRLATGIGPFAALRFYQQAVAKLLRKIAKDKRWKTVIALTPDRIACEKLPFFQGFKKFPQGRGDLGNRMARALIQAGNRPAVLVGGDIPDVTAAHIARAFRALDRADLVFGPAADGGFWLVGARTPKRDVARLFDEVRWSGPHALADTLKNIASRRKFELIDTLHDVDTAADLDALHARHKSG